jgi:hypothetical protein
MFVAGIQPLLSDPQPSERLLAAYALASWPGEKPPTLKDVLLAELKARATVHSYIAAQGLGKLGAQAIDAVPELLAYAQATKDGCAGCAESAVEAACRLQPELRTQYPNIDSKLKQEEVALSYVGPVESSGSLDTSSALADPEKGPVLLESLISTIQHNSDPDKAKADLIGALEQSLDRASGEQRTAIQNAIDAIRQTDISPKEAETERPPVSMISLVLDARILLQDGNNPNEERLERALDDFHSQHIRNVADASVNTERYRVLSEAIRGIDAQFHTAWRKQVLKNYPWLDRVLTPEEQ